VEEILAITHGNRRYQSFLRQRRFDHDLMQILGTMGHKPDEAVKLVVRDPGTGKEKTIEYPPVRWTPEVQLNDHWYALRSIDALPVEKILASAKNKDDDGWQRRFEEDIVEVLGEMGHKPGKTVRLALFDLETRKEKTLDAPMTEENRESLRAFRERVADLNPKALRPETG
jgi:hypothetical protein